MSTREPAISEGQLSSTPAPRVALQPLPAGAPTHAAIVEHRSDGDHLIIVELRSREVRRLSAAEETPLRPVWSPDGKLLIYQVKNTLFLHAEKAGPDKPIAERLAADAMMPYAFSPDGKWIAAALVHGAVMILSVASSRSGREEPRRIQMSPQYVIRDLLWSSDNRTLFMLYNPTANSSVTQLMRIDTTTRQTTAQPSEGVNRLLGWQAASMRMVVGRARLSESGGVGEEAGTLSQTGEFFPLREAEENEAGEFLLGFVSSTDQVILKLGREDTGDPVLVLLGDSGSQPAVPWLRRFPRLNELTISRDGRWAMFVDQASTDGAAPGGDIYLVGIGAEDAKLILKAAPDKEISYSSPVPRP